MLRVASTRPEPADGLLLVRAKAGDARAFEQIVREHQAMVFSLACRVTRNRSTAEELAQDVFLELYRSLDRLDSRAHLTYWLRRVTSHRCIDWCRREKRRVGEAAGGEVPEPVVTTPSRDVLFDERLWQLVAELAPQARMVIVLRYQEDLDPSEIADLLAMPVNTVKSHLRRSVALLRACLEGEIRAVR